MTTHSKPYPAGVPCWFDLTTPNVVEARNFYSALFGWEYDIAGEEFGFYSNALIGGKRVAGMGQPPPDTPAYPAWTVMLASDDLHGDVAKIKSLGGNVVVEPMEIPGQGHMVIANDSTGAVFGLWQSGSHFGAHITDEPGSMTWSEVNTRDAAKTLDFYTKIFGLSSQLVPTGIVYHMLSHGDQNAHGILQMDENWDASIPSHWMVYFAVSDLEQSIAKATGAGGKILVPPFDSGYGRISVLSDPHGTTFSIVQLKQR